MTSASTAVRRVRWTAAPPGTAARGALERWLAALDVRHYGLPPAAILVVRRARAPLPVLGGRSAHDPLAACVRGALRPALGGGGSADAVWFADEAELLACLARDTLAGAAGTRWWWPLVLPAGIDPAAARWQQAPRAVPAALRRLGPGAAGRWLARLSRGDVEALVAALATAFALPVAVQRAVLGRVATGAASSLLAEPDAAALSPAPTVAMDDGTGTGTVGTSTSARLLSLCDTLAGAPWAAACDGLAAELSAETAPARHGGRAVEGPPTTSAFEAHRVPLPAGADGTGDPFATARGHRPERDHRPATRTPVGRGAGPSTEAAAAGPAVPDETSFAPFPPAAPATPAFAPTTRPTRLHTAHGGLFFVLNAALALGLYGDFTQPRQRSLPVSPWRLLHASARAVLGRAFEANPLAAWLQARDPTPPVPGEAALLRTAEVRLQRRIGRALDLPPRRAMQLALALPAQLHDGGERIDLHFALAALPLPLRLAGLDRDPGWIPAAGCDLRFHFD